MTLLKRLIAPILFLTVLAFVVTFQPHVTARIGVAPWGEQGRNILTIAAYLGMAWLLSRVADLILSRVRPRSRPVPKLLRELISGSLFLVATLSGVMLLMGHSSGSALASSGIVLALLGFAVRNIVADILSGIALGLEAPFRIADWVHIEGLARGRVVEIGWRTTRLLTRDSTYVILPNSQISRQRIVNYSAPRSDFRAQMEITLDHAVPARKGVEILQAALARAHVIKQVPAPDVRIQAIEVDGIHYAMRYWLERFDHEIDARDAIWHEVDMALRRTSTSPPVQRIRILDNRIADSARQEEGTFVRHADPAISSVRSHDIMKPSCAKQ